MLTLPVPAGDPTSDLLLVATLSTYSPQKLGLSISSIILLDNSEMRSHE